MKRKSKKSGGARLIASGKRPILVGPTAEQHAELSKAAAIENRPVAQFVLHHALKAAALVAKGAA